MLSRTQRVIAAHLAELGIETKEASRIAKKQPIANPGSIKYVDILELKASIKKLIKSGLPGHNLALIHIYINESPKANQHYWDYTKGKKENFVQLVNNMKR
jgi:hypothetical protein